MFKSSIVQYGQSGRDKRYGSNTYRGNTDGTIVKDFLDFCEMKFKRPVKTCSDYMVGSGTTKDVCLERGIEGVWTDLRYGFNVMKEDCEIPDRPEAIFWHPPYSSMIGIPYAGKEWDDKEFIKKYGYDPKPYDLGRMDWDTFVKALNYCMLKMYSALESGGRMGVLMGDIRRNGVYKSMLLDIAKPGEVDALIIKNQCNTMSGSKVYSNKNFVPIDQEYFLILKKAAAYILDFTYAKKVQLDIRDSKDATWKDIVLSVLETIGKEAPLQAIYAELEGRKKCDSNPNWKAKVRQTLQVLRDAGFAKTSAVGTWAAAYRN